jgi:2-dehydro-3-deoxyphosphogluconate aldolase/(4S)-4-hydroxy-2-oxoglutarate aldolase
VTSPPVVSVLERLRALKVIAVVRGQNADEALQLSQALVAGGVGAIELTFTIPGAEAALAEARVVLGDHALVGAGTITKPDQVRSAAAAAADFLVSPHFNIRLFREMLGTGTLSVPGVLTPTEVVAATDAGASVLKLFPASVLSPAYLKALLGPFPGLRVIPTGGITPTTAAEWLSFGALAVGLGSELVPTKLRQAHAWEDISLHVAGFLRALEIEAPVPAGPGDEDNRR